MDMIRGPLHYLRAEKDSGSLLHAPQLHLIDRLQHFGIHKETKQLFEMANRSSFGTTDYFIDLANSLSYRCRPFAQDFETHAMKIICEDQLDLGIEKIDFKQIENLKFNYKKIVVVYLRKTSVKTDVKEACFLMLNIHSGWT